MISFTNRTRYGLPVALDLARHYRYGLTQISELAAGRGIPQNYLEQLFNRLVKAGVIRGVRGKKGGYALARDPKEITLLDILEVLEGPFDVAMNYPACDAVQEILKEAETSFKKLLKLSLAEVLIRQNEKYAQSIEFNI